METKEAPKSLRTCSLLVVISMVHNQVFLSFLVQFGFKSGEQFHLEIAKDGSFLILGVEIFHLLMLVLFMGDYFKRSKLTVVILYLAVMLPTTLYLYMFEANKMFLYLTFIVCLCTALMGLRFHIFKKLDVENMNLSSPASIESKNKSLFVTTSSGIAEGGVRSTLWNAASGTGSIKELDDCEYPQKYLRQQSKL